MFGLQRNPMDLRHEFEARLWRVHETFADYLYDKVTLANKVPVAERELIYYVVDGIPNETLKNQARIQRFRSTDEILEAFEKVTLPKEAAAATPAAAPSAAPVKAAAGKSASRAEGSSVTRKNVKTPSKQKGDNESIRCYNCNEFGHYAGNCSKPKREPGSCFTCGKLGHRAKQCGQQTTTPPEVHYVAVQREEDNEFERTVQLRLAGDNADSCISVRSVLDSRSPISFIKKSLVQEGEKTAELSKIKFCGVNGSEMRILGIVK
ncbi:uncharacterized protein LOC143374150 [Andrena cerasifolii]|uniref:uncharacterized protein LOC143374150 n=1 Tax=Andrena cerasifolii TaxID=2819439 RepID=UPI0040381415